MSKTPELFTYKWQTHTAKEWAKILGISYSNMYKRLNRYYNTDKDRCFRKHRAFVCAKINGENVPLKAIAKNYGLNYPTVYMRYRARKRGIIQSKSISDPAVNLYKHNGEKLTADEWCKRLHIKRTTFYARLDSRRKGRGTNVWKLGTK